VITLVTTNSNSLKYPHIATMASQLICCGIKFGWFDELVAHCQKVHAVQAAPTPQPASGGTPAQHSGSEDVEEAESNEGRHGESEENDEESNFEDDPQQAKKGSPTKVSSNSPFLGILRM